MTREVSGPTAGRPASAHASRLADEFARVLQEQGDGKEAAPLQRADVPGAGCAVKSANAGHAASADNADNPASAAHAANAAHAAHAAHAGGAADTADSADIAEVGDVANVTEPADAAGLAAAGPPAWAAACPVFSVAQVPPPPSSSTPAAAPAGSAAPAAAAASAASAHVVTASREPGAATAVNATTVALPDSGQAWELSIAEPGGLVLSLRAERGGAPASATAATMPAWSLAINAPAAEAAALQRHAPRLAERLAARALAPAHVRIDAQHESQHGD